MPETVHVDRGFDKMFPLDYKRGNVKGPIETLVELLEVDKLDVNERDKLLALTPLMKAAARNFCEAIDVLLDHGADKELKDNVGCTALHKAMVSQHHEAVELLLKRGAANTNMPRKRTFDTTASKWVDAPEDEQWTGYTRPGEKSPMCVTEPPNGGKPGHLESRVLELESA